MNRRNYQKELERQLERPENAGKRLLLHSCCAPCSSYVLEYLSQFLSITVFYYNPNISPEEEYRMRAAEQKRLIACMNEEMSTGERTGYPITILEGEYDPARFLAMARGLETEPEGGLRCRGCFSLRLSEAVRVACEGDYDYVTTTLTISPMKNAELLNEIGEELARRKGIRWLPSDFKKKNGYRRSVELSHQYGLYRQSFCGCIFSQEEARAREEKWGQRQENLISSCQTGDIGLK